MHFVHHHYRPGLFEYTASGPVVAVFQEGEKSEDPAVGLGTVIAQCSVVSECIDYDDSS